MKIVEFEVNIMDGIIKVPDEYKDLHDKHAKVTLSVKDDSIQDNNSLPPKETKITHSQNVDLSLNIEAQALDLSGIKISCFDDVNPVEYQRKIRDER